MTRIINRLYIYYQLSTSVLFLALFARWAVLYPLVSGRFLPGGIHVFLISLICYATVGELLWSLKFRRVSGTLKSATLLKDANLLYFCLAMNHISDYDHSLVLKNISYSAFIIGLSLSQCYVHATQMFKRGEPLWFSGFLRRVYVYILLPVMHLSEFNLLLLNVQSSQSIESPVLDIVHKIVLVFFLPLACVAWRKAMV
ncbi:Keg1p KNAG_0D02890 [Huiozyma naganishii CBS 8797]|uniref:Very-long-chain (3R)-3-hydroxyacyl-CoA dehydratase n=1 Tax=Huiozyma naganishii (strain ATCC MYA-139 / BCRC 22969 / CBS 8797 / KCTC 17520 / NBRC 10181 / NCYC 3082 / Yp74L-3) TaxID=1071383 RepID=J7RKL7_HUIN7|nr:hypothetical protein KNAG_0D02890 [Kazachstania naganishii CBS 8797]CCK70038.1 hypothetical protein KNAG_0D02890 [Kazachstania naganishii CBS 8797]